MGLGRIEAEHRESRITLRLLGWLALVAVLTLANYGSRLSGEKPPEDALYQWSYVVGGVFQFAIMLGIVLWIARGMPELLALRRPRSWPGAAWRTGVVLLAVFAMTVVLGPILDPGEEQGLTPDTWEPSRVWPLAANVLLVCVFVPFVEETMFRGVGFGLLEIRFGAEPAIVGSAVLFGLAHGLVEALPFIVALGIGLAWLRERQNSAVPGMILHGTFNAIGIAGSLLT